LIRLSPWPVPASTLRMTAIVPGVLIGAAVVGDHAVPGGGNQSRMDTIAP
jgi:hypothetical protein